MVSTEEIDRFARAIGPAPDEMQAEMAARADEEGFPIVGPAVGSALAALARLTDARRVFEFGSGFGYSASWFLRGMPEDGRVVCTEFDRDELEAGRRFFERAGLRGRVTFEHGDAMEAIERYDGPFDIALIDHQKDRYADAFDAIRPKLSPRGVLVADNVLRGPIDFDTLLAFVDGGADRPADGNTRGVADYLATVRDDPAFETTLLPLGSGVAVSHRVD